MLPTGTDSYRLGKACRKLGLRLTEIQLDLLVRYAEMLCDWNTRINLVSRKDSRRILSYHIIDSLAVASLIPSGKQVCDIGTGAGLPGIPLAISRPNIGMVLVESSTKRCWFLDTVITTLNLPTVTIINERAETIPYLQCDIVLSRLTTSPKRAIKEISPHRRPGGVIILFKTKNSAVELNNALSMLDKNHLAIIRTKDVILPISGITRKFIVIGPG